MIVWLGVWLTEMHEIKSRDLVIRNSTWYYKIEAWFRRGWQYDDEKEERDSEVK